VPRPSSQNISQLMVLPLVIASIVSLPDTIDWTAKGIVPPVKNQGAMGNSLVVVAAEAVESASSIASGAAPVFLSDQEILDCADSTMDWTDVFGFVEANGLCSAANYPTSVGPGTCHKTTCQPAARISSFGTVPVGNETALMEAVASGPVAAFIDASQLPVYMGGVVTSCPDPPQLDHTVLIVGYGRDGTTDTDFWKVMNSWGASWGEQGYVRVARGSNLCGIASGAAFVRV